MEVLKPQGFKEERSDDVHAEAGKNTKNVVENKMIKLGKYKHYKGDTMEVIGEALHSETLEEFAVYKHITGERSGESHYWVRPLKMFLENIEVNGKKIPRFKFIG